MLRKLTAGIVAGLSYGVAVAIVEQGFGTYQFTKNNLPAFTGTVLFSTAVMLALGGVLGLVAAPLVRSDGRAGFAHLTAITAMWLAVALWVAVDPSVVPMW